MSIYDQRVAFGASLMGNNFVENFTAQISRSGTFFTKIDGWRAIKLFL